MRINEIVAIAKESFSEWSEDGAPRLAAALAYYTAFSLGPLLFLVIAIAGLVFDNAEPQLISQLSTLIGEDAAILLSESAERMGPSGGWISTVIGLVVLLIAAGAVFGHRRRPPTAMTPQPTILLLQTCRAILEPRFLPLHLLTAGAVSPADGHAERVAVARPGPRRGGRPVWQWPLEAYFPPNKAKSMS